MEGIEAPSGHASTCPAAAGKEPCSLPLLSAPLISQAPRSPPPSNKELGFCFLYPNRIVCPSGLGLGFGEGLGQGSLFQALRVSARGFVLLTGLRPVALGGPEMPSWVGPALLPAPPELGCG